MIKARVHELFGNLIITDISTAGWFTAETNRGSAYSNARTRYGTKLAQLLSHAPHPFSNLNKEVFVNALLDSVLSSRRSLPVDSPAFSKNMSLLLLPEETGLHHRYKNPPANASSSVINNTRLPREPLIEVFQYAVPRKSDGMRVTHVCHNKCGRREHLCDMRRWMPAIAHVCRSWRVVALSTPVLWTQCMPPRLDGLKAFLERSQADNVLIDLELSFGQPREYVDLVLSQLQRARGLHVELDCYCADKPEAGNVLSRERLLALRSMPPSLEYLRIGGMSAHRGVNIPTPIAMACLPSRIDEGRFPKLRHVYLYWFPIKWDCGLLRRLRTLVIEGVNWQAYLTPNKFRNILAECPEIENLGISQATWKHDPDDLTVDSPMLLPNLRLARLDLSHPSILLSIMQQISFPTDAHVWITSQYTQSRNETAATYMKEAAPLLQWDGIPLWRLGIVYDRHRAGIYGSVFGSTGSLCINIYSRRFLREQTISLIDTLLDRDLSHLTEFECQLHDLGPTLDATSITWWRKTWNKAPSIKTLCLGVHGRWLVDALVSLTPDIDASFAETRVDRSKMPTSTTNSASSSMCLPALSELCLYDVDLSKILLSPNHRETADKYMGDIDNIDHHLKRCMRARSDAGCRLEGFNIKMYTKEPDDALCFDEFEELARHIKFDRLPLWPRSRWPVDFALFSRFWWAWEEA